MRTGPDGRPDRLSAGLEDRGATGLTARETELLRHLATGTDTRELAGRLSVSRHTVPDHLKSIFAKTSTRTRRALLSRALGS